MKTKWLFALTFCTLLIVTPTTARAQTTGVKLDNTSHSTSGSDAIDENNLAVCQDFLALFDAGIEMYDVEQVQQLSFVLVDALYLNVEHRVRIETDAARFVDESTEALLVFLLYLSPAFSKLSILCI